MSFDKWIYHIQRLADKPIRASSDGFIEDLSTNIESASSFSSTDLNNSFLSENLNLSSNYKIVVSVVMDLSFAKMISGEFIGETSEIIHAWESFKHFAEEDYRVDFKNLRRCRKNSLLEALNRKVSVVGTGCKNVCK